MLILALGFQEVSFQIFLTLAPVGLLIFLAIRASRLACPLPPDSKTYTITRGNLCSKSVFAKTLGEIKNSKLINGYCGCDYGSLISIHKDNFSIFEEEFGKIVKIEENNTENPHYILNIRNY